MDRAEFLNQVKSRIKEYLPEGMRLSSAQLKELMGEMQKTVRDKDFLSDYVYQYDRKSKAVELFDGKCHAETVRSYTDGNER